MKTQEHLYSSVASLYRSMDQMAYRIFSKHDISVSHAIILNQLKDQGQLYPSNISEQLNLSPSTVTRLVDKLVKKNWVERISDGKNKPIKLTPAGLKFREQTYQSWLEFTDELNELIGPELNLKIAQTLSEINKIIVEKD